MMNNSTSEQKVFTSTDPHCHHVLTDGDKEILKACHQAKERAYAPYSCFRVGAALLTEDGKIFLGCNVENAAYGACICAERTAIVKAVSEGYRRFQSIAVTTDLCDQFCVPCGTCRQFLAEFSLDCVLYSIKPNNQYVRTTLRDLLPHAFVPQYLELEHKPVKGNTVMKFNEIDSETVEFLDETIHDDQSDSTTIKKARSEEVKAIDQ